MNIILFLIYLSNFLTILYMIFKEKRSSNEILTWTLILNLAPVVGHFLFLLTGKKIHNPNMFGIRKKENEILNKYLKETTDTLKENNHNIVKKYSDMVKSLVNITHAPFTANNDVELYIDSESFFNNLLEDIKNAKYFIHIQFYIFKDDEIGTKILEALKSKAKEGVQVRFLYDSIGSRSIKKETIKKLRRSGVQTGAFFPTWFKFINTKINYRNHRKIVVIDNSIGFVGGFNVGDEYTGKNKRFGKWRDTHLKISGDAVKDLNLRFLTDWRYTTGEDIKLETILDSYPEYIFNGNKAIQIVSSGPDLVNTDEIKLGYLKMFQKANKYIYIQTPYLILDTSMSDALKLASLSGIDVRIMIPGKPDHPFVYWANLSYAGDLLESGVKIYHYNPKHFLHSKTVVIDDEICSIGTANLDIRSLELNFEVNAFVYSSEISTQQRKAFDDDIINCTSISKEEYSKRRKSVKVKEAISRLFSPLL